MTELLQGTQKSFINIFDSWAIQYFTKSYQNKFANQTLLDSQYYSIKSGGKRFRPFLCYLVFDLFSKKHEKIQNLCLAIEFIHTYSLIHDDLPSMDNDDFRRGKPTNHKVFGEAFALLAGDGLLTDSFNLIATDTYLTDAAKVKIIHLQSQLSGSFGMVSGQMFDMQANEKIEFEYLKKIHLLKTANLIQFAASSAAVAAGADEKQIDLISSFSKNLGLAFQVKDDLLDASNSNEKFKNFTHHSGVNKTQELLIEFSNAAKNYLLALKLETSFLEQLIDYNLQRQA